MAPKEPTKMRSAATPAGQSHNPSRKRPRMCPACGSRAVRRIVYGMPGEEMMRKAEAGLIVLGGCVIEQEQPHHTCGDCGTNGVDGGQSAGDALPGVPRLPGSRSSRVSRWSYPALASPVCTAR